MFFNDDSQFFSLTAFAIYTSSSVLSFALTLISISHIHIENIYIRKFPAMAGIVSPSFGLLVVVSIVLCPAAKALSLNYYDHTCPQLEYTVSSAVKKAILNDKTVPAALLRMHFHDCFIRVTNLLPFTFLLFTWLTK